MSEIKNVNRRGGNEIDNLKNNQTGKKGAAKKLFPDTATGRDATQFEAGKQLSALGGVSATDRLLGLDLRPTTTGILTAPPGNSEFLRHLSPSARRAIMRKMLDKQRERMRRLARYLRERHDETDEQKSSEQERESFLEVITEPVELNRAHIERATGELDKAARMLDILDEMLTMQNYTISRIGTFSQG